MDKILLIDKPCGMTTTYVTNKIKKYFNAEKAGHTGTLDPLATGVVPIFLGKLTKLIPFINENKKKYIVKAIIGLQTETLDISGISFHKIMQICERLDSIKEWGSIVALSYIASQRTFPFYSDMAEAKSVLESITRSYGYRFGKIKNVRVNTISQSPTKTTAGKGIKTFNSFYKFADKMSPLGNASADECANYCVFLFSDYSRKITMQNLFHDGGFSNTGISEEIIKKFD